MADDDDPVDLDLRGLACPLPVLRANKHLRALAPGTVLRLHVTDPAAPKDFEAFCETAGHALLAIEPTQDGHTVLLRKTGKTSA